MMEKLQGKGCKMKKKTRKKKKRNKKRKNSFTKKIKSHEGKEQKLCQEEHN